MYQDDDRDPGIWLTYWDILYSLLVGICILASCVAFLQFTVGILRWITPGAVNLR